MPKTLVYQGFSGLREEVVRPEGRPPRSPVLQALIYDASSSVYTERHPKGWRSFLPPSGRTSLVIGLGPPPKPSEAGLVGRGGAAARVRNRHSRLRRMQSLRRRKGARRACPPLRPAIPAPFGRANRAAASKPPCFSRRRRRVGDFPSSPSADFTLQAIKVPLPLGRHFFAPCIAFVRIQGVGAKKARHRLQVPGLF